MIDCPQCGTSFEPKTKTRPKKYCSQKCYRSAWHYANKTRMNERSKQWDLENPKEAAYRSQKSHAMARGIDFDFDLDEWIEWWGSDFDRRGRGPNQLCMARLNDEGPYTPKNTVKALNIDNWYFKI